MKKYIASFLLIILCSISPAFALEWQGVWNDFKSNVSNTFCSNKYEFYMPIRTWHNRWTYDRDNIKGYNERPWGGGLGQYYIDDKGNQHSLYTMVFKDSHNDFEPIAGYAWQKNWRLDTEGHWRIGAGFTVFITARSDFNYMPFPGVLPLLALEYKQVAIQGAYVPGFSRNSGNVALIWGTLKF